MYIIFMLEINQNVGEKCERVVFFYIRFLPWLIRGEYVSRSVFAMRRPLLCCQKGILNWCEKDIK